MEKISNYKSKFKKKIHIFQFLTDIMKPAYMHQNYIVKHTTTQLYPSFFFYEIAIWKTNFNILNLMPIDWRSSLTERSTLSGPESQQSSSLLNSPTTVWKSLLFLGCPRERRPIFRLCNLPCCNPPSSRDWQSWENVNTNTAKQTRYIKINEEAG